MNQWPTSNSARSPRERERLLRAVAERNLCGLANDTKWDEFLSSVRGREDWRPSYRYKCIDGTPSGRDVEWFYHLPFPLLSVEWLDVGHLQETRENRLPPRVHVIDHSAWLVELMRRVGLDHLKGETMIRVFGYSPKDMTLFDL